MTLLDLKASIVGPSQIVYMALNIINGVVHAKHCVAMVEAPHKTFHIGQFTTRIVVLQMIQI